MTKIELKFEKNSKGIKTQDLSTTEVTILGLEDYDEVTYSISAKDGGYLTTLERGDLMPSSAVTIPLKNAKTNSVLLVNGKNKGVIEKQVSYLIVERKLVEKVEHTKPNELSISQANFVKEMQSQKDKIVFKDDLIDIEKLKQEIESNYAKKDDIPEVDLSGYMPLSEGMRKSDGLQFAKATEVAILKQEIKDLREELAKLKE